MIVTVVAGLALALLWGWYDSEQGKREAVESIERFVRSQNEIEYCWSGTATSVSLTVENDSGNTEQVDDRSNDQCYTVGTFTTGEFVYLSVQNEGERGSVTCEIRSDGTVIEEATSSGSYVIATCSGRAR